MSVEITTPVGRLVWGHPTKARPKINKDTKQPMLDATGQPRQHWAFGVAFTKADFQAHIWPAMAQEAATAFPQGTPQKFSWKYQDGDGVDAEGKPFNQREGYAGCYILSVSSELMAPPVFKLVNGAYQQLAPEAIKCGDYVTLGLDLKVNVPTDRTHTPGIYVNPKAIEFIGYGTEIQSQGAVDPASLFKGQTHALPPGASATPVGAPSAPGMPGMAAPPMAAPPMAAPPMAAPPMAAPPMAAPPPPAMTRPVDPSHIAADPARPGAELWWNGTQWTPAPQLPPPAHDFVANAGMPPAPGMLPPR